MAQQVWLCDMCKRQHPTNNEAALCESSHPKQDSLLIKGAWYDISLSAFPSSLMLSFVSKEGKELFCTYTRDDL